MRFEAAVLANHAELRDGLLQVAGGGWETYTVQLLPASVAGAACGVVAFDSGRVEQAVLQVTVAQSGHEVGAFGSIVIDSARPQTVGRVPARVPFLVPFALVVSEPGEVVVNLTLRSTAEDAPEVAELRFAVLDPVPDGLG